MADKDIEFVNGLIVKPPRDGAPDFVIGSLSIKRLELIEWLSAREDEWINLDMKESKQGKWYAAVNDWKPQQQERPPQPQRQAPPPPRNEAPFPDDDIPF